MSCCNSPIAKLAAGAVALLVSTQFINTAVEFRQGKRSDTLVANILAALIGEPRAAEPKSEKKEDDFVCCGKGNCCKEEPAPKEVAKTMVCSATGEPCNCAYPIDEQFRQSKPIVVDLSDGKDKYICRCGASKNFPYCDGSHRKLNTESGTSISPLKINKEIAQKDKVYVCACGHAACRPDSPFCDGSHRNLVEVVEPSKEAEVIAEADAEVIAEEVATEAPAVEETVEETVEEPVAVTEEVQPEVVEEPEVSEPVSEESQ